jgi:His/Glu/Gln/Arg/opine family amino acid ABC transporter permease subunit
MLELLYEYWPKLAAGTLTTLKITLISFLLAASISLPLTIARYQGSTILQYPIRVYVSFFRGTPLLAQLFLVYYGSGQFRPELTELGLWWLFRDPYYCALLTFTLNSVAYQTEILRGGLQGVSIGEIEAGLSVGMDQPTLYRKIILPHAYRISLPALGNEAILLLKGGAIASVITILDLMGQTRRIFSMSFDINVYFWAAVIYLVITTIFVLIWHKIELRLNRHYSHRISSQNNNFSKEPSCAKR